MKRAVDDGYQLIATRYLRKQLSILNRNLKGIPRNDDIEYVHQARVASRRLRSGLRMFSECFSAKKVKKWRKNVRKLTKSLGAARDTDVQILFIKDFMEEMGQNKAQSGYKQNRPGIKRLLLRLEQKRARLQPKIEKTAENIQKSPVFDQMYSLIWSNHFRLKRRKVDLKSSYSYGRGCEHIKEKLGELLLLKDCLDDEHDIERHHQLRIASKRLRYTMEICRSIYGKEIEPAIEKVKHVQTLLGDIHDCDVWRDFITTFMEEETHRTIDYYGHERPFKRLRPGLEALQLERYKTRQARFAELVAFWHELDEQRFWQSLSEMVEAHVVPEQVPLDAEVKATASDTTENEGNEVGDTERFETRRIDRPCRVESSRQGHA